jgi:hypothetical protein
MKVTLNSEEHEQLKNLVSQWAEAVPEPDEAVVGFAGSPELLSPRDLAKAVRDETEVGKEYVQSLAKLAFKNLIKKQF